MNTQTHMLMGAALFGRELPRHAWAGILGGVIPDLPMYTIFAALKLAGLPDMFIFGVAYFDMRWQIANAIGHSLIMWPIIAASAWLLSRNNTKRWPKVILIMASSAIIHSMIDMLVHREDAHMHFWPLTQWKFISPVSYWNPAHYGNMFGIFELLLGLAMAVFLLFQYRHWLARILLASALMAYLGPLVYFRLN